MRKRRTSKLTDLMVQLGIISVSQTEIVESRLSRADPMEPSIDIVAEMITDKDADNLRRIRAVEDRAGHRADIFKIAKKAADQTRESAAKMETAAARIADKNAKSG